MAKIIPISEHFQHFLAEVKESFWGDLYGQTKLAWQRFSSCSRSASGAAIPAPGTMNRGAAGAKCIATAIMSGIL